MENWVIEDPPSQLNRKFHFPPFLWKPLLRGAFKMSQKVQKVNNFIAPPYP